MEYTIHAVTRLQDNGDGGYTMYVYNNEDELISDHPNSKRWNSETHKDETIELTEEERKKILSEDDPYENGYIGLENITIKVENGVASIVGHLSFHAGQ